MPVVAWCSAVRCSTPSACATGRVVAVPWWSHIRHHQTTVSTNAIASMLNHPGSDGGSVLCGGWRDGPIFEAPL